MSCKFLLSYLIYSFFLKWWGRAYLVCATFTSSDPVFISLSMNIARARQTQKSHPVNQSIYASRLAFVIKSTRLCFYFDNRVPNPLGCNRCKPSMSTDSLSGAPRLAEHGKAGSLLSFFRLVGRLKETKRAGWVRSGVQRPESVSDHMYRMALIAFTAAPDAGVNGLHAAKLALVHDLAEALVGDITPHDGVSPQDKRKREQDAMQVIRDNLLKDKQVGNELYDLWVEYEESTSDEARFVKQIDKLEMVLQADEYEQAQGVHLEDFFQSTKDVVTTEPLKSVDSLIRKQREDRANERHGGALSSAVDGGDSIEDGESART